MGFRGFLAAGMACLLAVGTAAAASAAELALRWVKANGDVLGEKVLTTEELEAMPQEIFTTNTPWTTAPTEFKGPSIKSLAALGEVPAAKANIIAINDYSAEIPAQDWETHGATLAVRLNGETMRIREKGPFWVMYPIDADPKVLDTQLYHSRMVWQVKSIDFVVE
jgi:hypothetical protein